MRPRSRWRAWIAAAALGWSGSALAAGGAAQAQAAEGPRLLGGLLQQTRVVYPLKVGKWRAVGEQRMQEQAHGVSVRYVHGDAWLDLYIYPGGPMREANLARAAEAERGNIGQAAAQGGRDARLGELQSVHLPGQGGGPPVPAWVLELEYPGEGLGSAMLLFARNLHLVKARASAPRQHLQPGELPREVQAFMGGISRQLRITSTGDCWLPRRLRVVDTLPDPQAPQVLASYSDPEAAPSAVVTLGGIEVARAEAGRAEALARMMGDALYPGCVAPEEIEPLVPEGWREIRIEYRDTSARRGRQAPAGRLRARWRSTG